MLSSDTAALEILLSDGLVFTDHTGSLYSKADDINSYKTGFVSIHSITCSDQRIYTYENTAIVSVLMDISGTFGGSPANGKFRFTRTWYRVEQDKWQIISAHSTLLTQ